MNPIPPTYKIEICRGSSVVELSPEERGVVSSILTRGTKRDCGCSTVVVHLVANQSTRVRFPSPAQKITFLRGLVNTWAILDGSAGAPPKLPARHKQLCLAPSPAPIQKPPIMAAFAYLACSTNLFSLIRVTLISPGYLSSSSMRFAISRAIFSEEASSIFSGVTKTRISRPA